MGNIMGVNSMGELLTEKQKENFAFFQEKLEELAANPLYKLKHVVIHEKKIVGIYDTFAAAITFAVQTLPQGEFIIQEIVLDSDVVSFLYPAMS
jgi:hypothetical protein